MILAPSGPPQSPTASALSALSIQISWQAPLLPDRNGMITGYVINVTSLDTGISQQLTSVNTTIQVPNLAPYTNYVCIVAANTAIGVGPFSTVINVQTLEAGKAIRIQWLLLYYSYLYMFHSSRHSSFQLYWHVA